MEYSRGFEGLDLGARPPDAQGGKTLHPLATIGYQEAAQADVIGKLKAAGVEIVIDVRAVAASRRAGFSKKLLAASLAEAGIDYLHLRDLGTPKPGRMAARAGRTQEMRDIFAAHMEDPEAQHALAYAAEVAGQRRAALLCYCAEAPRCHRDIVGAMIAARTGLEVVDL